MKVKANINRMIDKENSNVKAFATATFDGMYVVHGLKVCKGEKGLFVGMPSVPYRDKSGEQQYSDMFNPITKGAREALTQSVLNAYNIKLQQIQETEIEVDETIQEEDISEDIEPEPEMSL